MVGSIQEEAADNDDTVSADDDMLLLELMLLLLELMLLPLDDAMVLLVLAVSELSSLPQPEGFDGFICTIRL